MFFRRHFLYVFFIGKKKIEFLDFSLKIETFIDSPFSVAIWSGDLSCSFCKLMSVPLLIRDWTAISSPFFHFSAKENVSYNSKGNKKKHNKEWNWWLQLPLLTATKISISSISSSGTVAPILISSATNRSWPNFNKRINVGTFVSMIRCSSFQRDGKKFAMNFTQIESKNWKLLIRSARRSTFQPSTVLRRFVPCIISSWVVFPILWKLNESEIDWILIRFGCYGTDNDSDDKFTTWHFVDEFRWRECYWKGTVSIRIGSCVKQWFVCKQCDLTHMIQMSRLHKVFRIINSLGTPSTKTVQRPINNAGKHFISDISKEIHALYFQFLGFSTQKITECTFAATDFRNFWLDSVKWASSEVKTRSVAVKDKASIQSAFQTFQKECWWKSAFIRNGHFHFSIFTFFFNFLPFIPILA